MTRGSSTSPEVARTNPLLRFGTPAALQGCERHERSPPGLADPQHGPAHGLGVPYVHGVCFGGHLDAVAAVGSAVAALEPREAAGLLNVLVDAHSSPAKC